MPNFPSMRNELEIYLGLWWDFNPGLSLVQILVREMRYRSAKGEIAHSQGQESYFQLKGHVISERCRSNLLIAFAFLDFHCAPSKPAELNLLRMPSAKIS